jgi:hypothetical protein
MKIRNFYILFLFLTFFTSNKLHAQEKKKFLQDRYDGTTEVITKNHNKKKLTILKSDFKRSGIDFNFSKLAFNKENEITRITLTIKNKKSAASLILNKKNSAIPSINIGEKNGIVVIKVITINGHKNSEKTN